MINIRSARCELVVGSRSLDNHEGRFALLDAVRCEFCRVAAQDNLLVSQRRGRESERNSLASGISAACDPGTASVSSCSSPRRSSTRRSSRRIRCLGAQRLARHGGPNRHPRAAPVSAEATRAPKPPERPPRRLGSRTASRSLRRHRTRTRGPMNPARSALDLVARPAGAVAHALNRPTAFGRNRPLYGLNLLDALRGTTLEDALRDRIVLITGASSGIGATLATKLGAAGGEVVLVARTRDKLDETAAEVHPPAAQRTSTPAISPTSRPSARWLSRSVQTSGVWTSSSTTPDARSADR